ncbi:MAG: hypothetical protein CSA70_07280 [Rhodobacterales bacterium]|nr:MAG: hypothetical protein CSA70_07280 [Rhodobacterales bacterium]
MKRLAIAALCLGVGLSACGNSNPFTVEEDTGTDGSGGSGGGSGTGIEGRGLPPGTTSPTPNTKIVRYEDVNDIGGGYVSTVSYNNDAGQDEFTVDGIAFDGDNTYSRGTLVSSLGPFAVYESDSSVVDPLTGNSIGTLDYRAIYGVSTSGQTEFAIVRSGDYGGYGFGGFIYQRNQTDDNGDPVSLVLPDNGDAQYNGDYAGTRVFNGRSGLEFVTGQARMTIDFKDFNEGRNGVLLRVYNRRLFDANGTDITNTYLTAIEGLDTNKTAVHNTDGAGNNVMPEIRSRLSPGIADGNGELIGEIYSNIRYSDGSLLNLDTGSYYAIMSGQNAEEIVGVLVMEQNDPRGDPSAFNTQETGGFIIYRN